MTSRKRMSVALGDGPRTSGPRFLVWPSLIGLSRMVQPDGTEQVSGLLVEEIARSRQGRPKIDYNAMGRHRKARNIRVLAVMPRLTRNALI